MPELVAKSDIILGNEEDCEKVFGIKPKNFDAEKVKDNINPEIFKDVCSQMMKKFPHCKKWLLLYAELLMQIIILGLVSFMMVIPYISLLYIILHTL